MTTKARQPRRKRQPSAAAQAKRLELCEKSKAAKAILENIEMFPFGHPYRECEKVNHVLMYWHQISTGIKHPDAWNTFKGWKELGFSVQKRSKGFLIWGRPRKMKGKVEQQTKSGSIEETEKEFSAFPICYLFHAGQVKDANGNSFDANNLFIRLALIPKKVKRQLLCLPAPQSCIEKGGHNAA